MDETITVNMSDLTEAFRRWDEISTRENWEDGKDHAARAEFLIKTVKEIQAERG